MRMGNLSSSEVSSAAPKMTSGIVVARPIARSENTTSPPILAAPTSAITLSSDMTASATMMILIASHAVWPACTLSSSSSPPPGSSWTSFQAINSSKSPPALGALEAAGGHGDDHGVVAGENKVDGEHLDECEPINRLGQRLILLRPLPPHVAEGHAYSFVSTPISSYQE